MKLMFCRYRYLTETVFPELAIKYGWSTCNEKDIKTILCRSIGIEVPVHPSRLATRPREMRKLLTLCYNVLENPLIFLFL